MQVQKQKQWTPELERETNELQFDDADNFKNETLPDGWILTYEDTSSKTGTHKATVQRKLGEQEINCSINADSDAQRQKGLGFCRSLARR